MVAEEGVGGGVNFICGMTRLIPGDLFSATVHL